MVYVGDRQQGDQIPEAYDPEPEEHLRGGVLGEHHRGDHSLRLRPERQEQEKVSGTGQSVT
jgi:hypothetical protein